MAYTKAADAKKEASKQAVAELGRRLSDGDTEGLYIFSGDEEYMKRYYFSSLCRAAGDGVNVTTLRGEMDFGQLCDELASVPMQEFSLFEHEGKDSKKRVIKLESPDFSKLSDREMAEIHDMLSDLGSMSIVVIYFSNIEPLKGKSNQAIIKKLSEGALVCDFQRADVGDAKLLRWIKKHFDKEKISISQQDVRYLCECVGTDMCLLSFEIEKLCAYILHKGRTEVTREDIDFICIKNVEAITFDVTNAIVARDFDGAVTALSKLRAVKTEPLLIFGAITKTVGDITLVSSMMREGKTTAEIIQSSGLRDFVVRKYAALLNDVPKDYAKKAARLCLDADEKLKRGAKGYLVLENLIFRLIK